MLNIETLNLTVDPFEFMDDMSEIYMEKRMYIPCACCGKRKIATMQCACEEQTRQEQTKQTKQYINMFMVSMVISAVLTMVLM